MQVRKNPAAYGFSGSRLSEQAVEKVLKDQLVLTNVRELAKHGLVSNVAFIPAAKIGKSVLQ